MNAVHNKCLLSLYSLRFYSTLWFFSDVVSDFFVSNAEKRPSWTISPSVLTLKNTKEVIYEDVESWVISYHLISSHIISYHHIHTYNVSHWRKEVAMICHVSPSETRHSTAQIRRVTHARFQSVGLSVEAQQARSRVDTSVQEPGLHSQYCAGCDALSVRQNYKKHTNINQHSWWKSHTVCSWQHMCKQGREGFWKHTC